MLLRKLLFNNVKILYATYILWENAEFFHVLTNYVYSTNHSPLNGWISELNPVQGNLHSILYTPENIATYCM
jgi:hypothetical protein